MAVIAGAFIPLAFIAAALFARRLVQIACIVTVDVGIVAVDHVVIKAVAAALAIAAAITTAFGLALAIIAQHAEIMFGILQIIFCSHPIAGLLRVAGQGAIFFQKLGGVATLAVIQPRAIIIAAGHLLRTRTIAAATTTPPLIVPDQDRRSRSWPHRAAVGQKHAPNSPPGPSRPPR